MRGGAEGESADKIAEWSGKYSDGSATDEDATTTEGAYWDGKPRVATEGGTRESGVDKRLGDAMAGEGNTGKASSAAADESGVGDCHGARPEQRGRFTGRRENPAGESSEVQGNNGGCESSGMAHNSSGVGDKAGGREASGVAENPRGYRQGVGGGFEFPQGTNTPRVAELPRGDETPRATTASERVPGEDRRGRGGGQNPPHHPSK